MRHRFIPLLPINYRNRTWHASRSAVIASINCELTNTHLRPSVSRAHREKKQTPTRHTPQPISVWRKRKAFVQSIVENRRASSSALLASPPRNFVRERPFSRGSNTGRETRAYGNTRTRLENFNVHRDSAFGGFCLNAVWSNVEIPTVATNWIYGETSAREPHDKIISRTINLIRYRISAGDTRNILCAKLINGQVN